MSFARLLLVLPIALNFTLPGSVVPEETVTGTADTPVEPVIVAPVAPTAAATPPVVIGAVGEDRERVEWALGQFEAAGLGFSDLEVRFAGDPEPCNGNLGVHRTVGDTHLVVICNRDASRRHVTLAHELAHVWAAQNLDDTQRSPFLAARGLSEWDGADLPWRERGTEHAAEIIAWGVRDHPCWVVPRAEIGDRDIDALAVQFEVLTGFPPRCDREAVQPLDLDGRQEIE